MLSTDLALQIKQSREDIGQTRSDDRRRRRLELVYRSLDVLKRPSAGDHGDPDSLKIGVMRSWWPMESLMV